MDYAKAQHLVAEGKNLNQIAKALKVSPENMRKADPKLEEILVPLAHNPAANSDIDYKQVEYLANLQCAEYEIAQAIKYLQLASHLGMDCNPSTLTQFSALALRANHRGAC